jgi:hypothetical protein
MLSSYRYALMSCIGSGSTHELPNEAQPFRSAKVSSNDDKDVVLWLFLSRSLTVGERDKM